jgi:hypothetical protein
MILPQHFVSLLSFRQPSSQARLPKVRSGKSFLRPDCGEAGAIEGFHRIRTFGNNDQIMAPWNLNQFGHSL